jgi:alpha-tubulin suppressor-like RCC1 family protein
VVQAVCGGTHTIALTDEGRIFIWGRGSFGATPAAVFVPLL